MNIFFIPEPIFQKFARIIFLCVLSLLTLLFTKWIINTFFNSLLKKTQLSGYSQRISTLNGLLQNSISLVFFVLLVLMILRDTGFDIAPLLTGAGLLGLAISFGSQTLIKDMISGFFIIIENQYNIGDTVKMGELKGVVEKINLRTTVLTDKNENSIYIPNSEIKEVIVYKKTQ